MIYKCSLWFHVGCVTAEGGEEQKDILSVYNSQEESEWFCPTCIYTSDTISQALAEARDKANLNIEDLAEISITSVECNIPQ